MCETSRAFFVSRGEAIDFEYIESWLERLGVADVWKLVKARSKGSNPQHE